MAVPRTANVTKSCVTVLPQILHAGPHSGSTSWRCAKKPQMTESPTEHAAQQQVTTPAEVLRVTQLDSF